MRILVAPDKFKGSFTAAEAAEQMGAGLRAALPEAEIILLPVADGGEGTASVICAAARGEWHECDAHDALGEIVRARYCTIDRGETAVAETSEASGLWRIPPEQRDPTAASSLGTGEMLLHAAARGVKQIIVGLGGSATNDGGFGMARALGFRFLDRSGNELRDAVSELVELSRIVRSSAPLRCRLVAAADVRIPLLGERGATRMFGQQKGAAGAQLSILEEALTQLADVVARDLGCDYRQVPGAGAAGGLGFGLMSFCGAEMRSGFDVVAEAIGLEAAVRAADVVVTGEGRLDAQTVEGKAPAGVARMARRLGKHVFAIVGSVSDGGEGRDLFDHVLVVAQAPTAPGPATNVAGSGCGTKAESWAERLAAGAAASFVSPANFLRARWRDDRCVVPRRDGARPSKRGNRENVSHSPHTSGPTF